MIYESQYPITGLAFKVQHKFTVLFVATKNEVLAITILAKEKDQKVGASEKMMRPIVFFFK